MSIQDKYFYTTPEGLQFPILGDDPNKPYSYLKEEKQFEIVINKMEHKKTNRTLKAIWDFTRGTGLSGVAAGVAYVASNVALIILAASLAPFAIPNPFFSLILLGAGLVVGGAVGYGLYKLIAEPYFTSAQKNWDYSEQYVDTIDQLLLAQHGRFSKKQ